MWPPKQGEFGWKGFRPDPGKYTTVTTIIAIGNLLLLLFAVDALFERDESGAFQLMAGPFGWPFYAWCFAVMATSVLTASLIQYEDTQSRWGARAFACGIPFLGAVFLLLRFPP